MIKPTFLISLNITSNILHILLVYLLLHKIAAHLSCNNMRQNTILIADEDILQKQ